MEVEICEILRLSFKNKAEDEILHCVILYLKYVNTQLQ